MKRTSAAAATTKGRENPKARTNQEIAAALKAVAKDQPDALIVAINALAVASARARGKAAAVAAGRAAAGGDEPIDVAELLPLLSPVLRLLGVPQRDRQQIIGIAQQVVDLIGALKPGGPSITLPPIVQPLFGSLIRFSLAARNLGPAK